ncbi:hypothetical protein BJI67_16450 (plasmid) [Acidihalobacter aeolianus]|uniref:ParB-like N-terminal domain-containing protein n=1 Tax=Acidihalobacter aeolianus TaxID=2792603 RepID=A0A1D8KCY2_9GAMM|nr:ParB/RepB/Spo0J family partition protein [Acidihalobacter aeolianus]AOV18828.1 hypothetical protein BJI67_16450 [Acidihalobacter aeolianus]
MNEPQKTESDLTVVEIPVTDLVPGRYQMRTVFQDNGLAESIRNQGIIQPIVARGECPPYEIIAGERRCRAAKAAGLELVPVILRNDLDERQAATFGLVENIQRHAFNPIEEAKSYEMLAIKFGLTHEMIATDTGVSRTQITNTLRLLKLSDTIQSLIIDGSLSGGHAKTLTTLNPAAQEGFAKRAIREGWSVRKLEEEVAKLKALLAPKPPKSAVSEQPLSIDANRLGMEVGEKLGLPVKLKWTEGRGGVFEITVFSVDDADRVVAKLLSAVADKPDR